MVVIISVAGKYESIEVNSLELCHQYILNPSQSLKAGKKLSVLASITLNQQLPTVADPGFLRRRGTHLVLEV